MIVNSAITTGKKGDQMNEAILSLKRAIEENELRKSDIALEIGWGRQRLHALLDHGLRIDIEDYWKLRKAIEDRGVRIDGTETMSITGLAAYINIESSKLISECVKSMEDGFLTNEERTGLLFNVNAMLERLSYLKIRLLK
jgi:hypothetical protein